MANKDTKTPLLPVLPEDMAKQAAREIRKATLPSKSPTGAGLKKFPANVGLMGQTEALKLSSNPIKNAGPAHDPAKHLPYRKPAIEGGEGPHAV